MVVAVSSVEELRQRGNLPAFRHSTTTLRLGLIAEK
jgi:hypothetical protein